MADPLLSLDDFMPFRLSIVSNAVSDAIASTYHALFGLRIAEWRLVAVIAESDGLSQQALGARTRMDKVTVSRAAIALAERGLIARRANPDDQRSHLLSLTPAGRALYEQVAPKALEMESRIFAGLGAADLAHFRAVLDRVEVAAGGLQG
ncbi:MAG TPA: MarR family transcriptional regulator [Sphingomonas sp.]|jgi:DNA-binding MarR family transcriptional regulator|uniref:MarR family winged helix-turn-helix transcriptional regulator n=1 Tax=Sphingomonas sp. TaxID=28214 RepID=UPI002EDB0516